MRPASRPTSTVEFAPPRASAISAEGSFHGRVNPQRYEMEQLSAIVYEDRSQMLCVGYKDITDQEFWVRGHFPGMPWLVVSACAEAIHSANTREPTAPARQLKRQSSRP